MALIKEINKEIYELECYEIMDSKYYIRCDYEEDYTYYQYVLNDNYIYNYNEKFPLTDEGKERVIECCKKFDEYIDYVKTNYACINYNHYDFELKKDCIEKYYYKRIDNSYIYDVLITQDRYMNYIGRRTSITFNDIIPGTYKNIEKDKVYLSAINNKDRLLELRRKDYYSLLTKEEEKEMSEILGIKFIRKIDSKNKDFEDKYFINKEELTSERFKYLYANGYDIRHDWYLAMNGKTHEIYTLYPKRKYGLDAAPIASRTISFEEFIKLFD